MRQSATGRCVRDFGALPGKRQVRSLSGLLSPAKITPAGRRSFSYLAVKRTLGRLCERRGSILSPPNLVTANVSGARRTGNVDTSELLPCQSNDLNSTFYKNDCHGRARFALD